LEVVKGVSIKSQCIHPPFFLHTLSLSPPLYRTYKLIKLYFSILQQNKNVRL
jgi:hypothetical protein